MTLLLRHSHIALRSACRNLSAAAFPEIGSKAHIESLIKADKVVVFMKGNQDRPQCGFSNAVCQILKFHEVPFKDHNVLADDRLRQGIKDFSNWPTIPQIFIEQEFIGGCDILIQMHKSGDLVERLAKAGILSPHAKLVKEE